MLLVNAQIPVGSYWLHLSYLVLCNGLQQNMLLHLPPVALKFLGLWSEMCHCRVSDMGDYFIFWETIREYRINQTSLLY